MSLDREKKRGRYKRWEIDREKYEALRREEKQKRKGEGKLGVGKRGHGEMRRIEGKDKDRDNS